MDPFPGAYPASEPPTPAPESSQQQPQYHAQQPSDRALAHHSEFGTPSPLAKEYEPHDGSTQSHTDTGVGLTNADYHRLRQSRLPEHKTPAVQEAVGGGTYVREDEGRPSQSHLEEPPRQTSDLEYGEQAGWPRHDAQGQTPVVEEQSRKVHQYQAHDVPQRIHEVQQEPHHVRQNKPELQEQSRTVHKQEHGAQHDGQHGIEHGVQQSQEYNVKRYQHLESHQQPRQVQQEQFQPQAHTLDVHHQPPLAPLESQTRQVEQQLRQVEQQPRQVEQQPRQVEQQPRQVEQQPRQIEQQPRQVEQQPPRNSSSTAGSNSNTPPYWGSLPAAATGGIYNTVTGHGSGRDDHDQHHRLPERERGTEHRSADSAVPRAAPVFPSGGVYNTVTGHGSNDEHSKQHDTTKSAHATTATAGHLLGARTAAGGDKTDHYPSISGSNLNDAQTRAAAEPRQSGAGAQRAFPLAKPDRDGHRAADSHSRAQQGLATGALAGTGVAAYEFSGKDSREAGHDTRDVPTGHRHSPTNEEHGGIGPQSTSHTQHHPNTAQNRASLDHKDKHEDEASKPHKTHGILGIFHRHKDDKKQDEPHHKHHRDDSTERRKIKKEPPPAVAQAMRESTPPKRTSHEEDNHRQAGVASGSYHDHDGVHKNLHPTHDSRSARPSTEAYSSATNNRTRVVPTEAPAAAHSQKYDEASHHGQRRDESAAIATGAGVGAGGLAASHLVHHDRDSRYTTESNAAQTTSHTDMGPSSYEHSQPVHFTSPSSTQRNESDGYNALGPGSPSGIVTSGTGAYHPGNTTHNQHVGDGIHSSKDADRNSAPYNTLPTGTTSGAAIGAGAGTAAGLASLQGTTGSGLSHNGEPSNATDNWSSRTGTYGTYGPRHSGTVLGTSTSGIDTSRSAPPASNARTGNTGGASLASMSTSDRHSATNSRDNSGAYNVLGSGTASGIAAAGTESSHSPPNVASHRVKDSAVPSRQGHKQGSGASPDLPNPYNVLPSGTPSGVNIEYRRRSKEIERRDGA